MASTAPAVPHVPLGERVEIPQLGFGVFQIAPGETVEAVSRALEAGYRHIDTAAAYGNEAQVGEAIRSSGLSREDVFVTTKCPNGEHGYDEALRALRGSLQRLQMKYVDLYLIHWPIPARDRYVPTWRALIDAQREGLARTIGVSNFRSSDLQRVIEETGVTPAINQIELHPYFQQKEMARAHSQHGIVTEAWSPLAQGAVLDDGVITTIADTHGKSPGQVVIRWHLQLGNVVIPKSATPERIRENFEVFDFELSAEEMRAIEQLDRGERTGPDPETFGA